jgi:acetyl/propionyl-CoA carboxylase alpha subunit
MGKPLEVDLELRSPRAVLKRGGSTLEAIVRRAGNWVEIEAGGRTIRCAAAATSRGVWVALEGRTYFLERRHREAASVGGPHSADEIRAPMTGRVATVAARPGGEVREGDLLLTIEAMKMEFKLTAPEDGVVKKVLCAEGDRVDLAQLLVTLDPRVTP